MRRLQTPLLNVALGAVGILLHGSRLGRQARRHQGARAPHRRGDRSSPPFSYRDGEKGGRLRRRSCGEVAKRLGIGLEKVSIINVERVPSLQQDKVDLVATGMTRAENRKRDIGFSLAIRLAAQSAGQKGRRHHRRQADGRAQARPGEIGERRRRAQGGRPDARDRPARRLQRLLHRLAGEARRRILADEILLLSFARKGGAPQDFTFIPDYDLPRTAGFGIKKNEPRFTEFVDQTLLALEAAGAAAKIFDAWFAPSPRLFKFQRD
jgi:hypothetical protein